MGIYINEKLITLPENKPADKLAADTAAAWREAHKDDVSVEPVYDQDGIQTNREGRTEEVIADAPTFVVTQLSDGTVRKDNKLPPAPKPAPVTVDTKYRYTAEDVRRLSSKDLIKVQVSDGGMTVSEQRPDRDSSNANWLDKKTPR